MFGVTIEEAVQRSMLPDGVQLPRIIRECIIQLEDKGLSNKSIFGLNWSEYITHVSHFSSHLFIAFIFPGLSQEGIYRLSGVKSKIEMLKELYNQGETFFQTFPSLLVYLRLQDTLSGVFRKIATARSISVQFSSNFHQMLASACKIW